MSIPFTSYVGDHAVSLKQQVLVAKTAQQHAQGVALVGGGGVPSYNPAAVAVFVLAGKTPAVDPVEATVSGKKVTLSLGESPVLSRWSVTVFDVADLPPGYDIKVKV